MLHDTWEDKLYYTYGLTVEEYRAMDAAQEGRCAICRQPESAKSPNRTPRPKRLSVDHNHETGQVRSLLCGRCNAGLGMFTENPEYLREAVRYLEYHAELDKQV